MSAFDDILAMDAAFICAAEFSEQVYYHGFTDRLVSAVIDRSPPRKPMETAETITDYFLISVPNSATLGVTVEEVNAGRTTIDIPKNKGDLPNDPETPLVTYRIVNIESQDAGMLVLRVR